MKARLISILLIISAVSAINAQTTYLLTQFPKIARSATVPDTIEWTGVSRPLYTSPDSGVIYFSRSPGGSNIDNYSYSVKKFYVDTQSNGSQVVQDNIYLPGIPPKRRIIFKPSEQTNMGYGLYYYIVGFKTSIGGKDTMLVSNELEMIVESPTPVTQKSPSDTITSLTPTFQWQANAGVPYYHIILSDEALNIDTVNGEINIAGLSISWQAITPYTQIVYGAPDPSGTITAEPPPISPGKTYYWAVLNNYKNNALYSSTKVGLPLSFTIKGTPLIKAKNISPKNVTLSSVNDSIITFKWTNLDPAANTYKVYLYVTSGDVAQIDAKLVTWSTEVTSATFAGANGKVDTTDTAYISINAHSVLTKNTYTWKVFAVDNQGAGTCGDTSTFEYTDPSTGYLHLNTVEKIISTTTLAAGNTKVDTTLSPVSIVELNVEVVNGSSEAPLLFYTDNDGYLSRERPSGVYRITAEKSGFESLTKTITLNSDQTVTDTFFLTRPDATVYGKVTDSTGVGINVANVYAVSDRNDTVSTQTDALGSFILNCYESSWRIYASKSGYVTSVPKQADVVYGQSYSFGSIVLPLNPYTLSGTVKNENGEPILGVNVKILSGNTTIGEVPSTPQTGAFSFSLNSGTYTVYATKAGFETYSNQITVSGTMQMSVAMSSGAAMIKGYVIGSSWIGKSLVYAPVTNATITFSDTTSPAKTFSATTDATYGEYNASVTAKRTYNISVTASGFVSKTSKLPSATETGKTMTYNDTVTALAMIFGKVITSTGLAVENATVSLLDPQTNMVKATGTSQGDGYFEVRSISDGIYYVKAGASGYVMDSVRLGDTINVDSGKAVIRGSSLGDSIKIFMSPGEKIVSWVVFDNRGLNDTTATVSIKSPLQKIIRPGKQLTEAGYGDYIVSVNVASDSVVDCSYHAFAVAASESLHVDTVRLDVINGTDSILTVKNDSVTTILYAALKDTLDSAVLYYRDINASSYSSIVNKTRSDYYRFAFLPPKDGSTLNYYFRAFRGKNVYGSSSETYYAYINPDTSRVSKLALSPATTDTVLLAAKGQLKLKLLSYYSSSFIPGSVKDSTAVKWKLLNAPKGTSLTDSTGVDAVLSTGSDSSITTAIVKAVLDTSKQRVTNQVAVPEVYLYFKVSSKTLGSISVTRTDAGAPNAITTSSISKAEFSATGLDADKRILTITPSWSITPENAGTISSDGIFKPKSNFCGHVRIYAQSGSYTGEYNSEGESEKEYGIEVNHIVVTKQTFDTAANMRGCTVIFPDSVVTSDNPGLLQISMPALSNRLQLSTGDLAVIGSAYDIIEENGANLQIGKDSIRLVLDITDAAVENLAGSSYSLYLGTWNEDSLKWDSVPGTTIDKTAKTISSCLSHFSRYAILAKTAELTSSLSILPNPFSPDKSASEFTSLALRLGKDAPKGTCISFTPQTSDATIQKIKIEIFNLVGEQVARVTMQSVSKMTEYHLWWDGRTTQRSGIEWNPVGTADDKFVMHGDKMCRNGRYFVVLTIKDYSGKEKKYMKQVVLIK
jgi:hypothetical protein